MNKDLSYATAAWQSSCELKRETSCNMVWSILLHREKRHSIQLLVPCVTGKKEFLEGWEPCEEAQLWLR